MDKRVVCTKNELKWFAHGGGVRSGPFSTQVEAWRAMRYTDEMQKRTRLIHPVDTHVWPEDDREMIER